VRMLLKKMKDYLINTFAKDPKVELLVKPSVWAVIFMPERLVKVKLWR